MLWTLETLDITDDAIPSTENNHEPELSLNETGEAESVDEICTVFSTNFDCIGVDRCIDVHCTCIRRRRQ